MQSIPSKYNSDLTSNWLRAGIMDGMLPFDDAGQGLYCTGCQAVKAVDRFSKNKAHKSGHNNWCKDCMRGLYTRPDYLERRKLRRLENPLNTLMIECRCRARGAGVPFDLGPEDIEIPPICPVLGISLVWQPGSRADGTPTIDRIIPATGYVRGNVAVISWLANRIKSDITDPAVFDAIAAYIRRHQAQ